MSFPCKLCGEQFPTFKELNHHRWKEHREQMLVQTAEARAKRRREKAQGGKDGKGQGSSSGAGARPASSLEEASILAIAPRRFEMTSTLLWQARAAAIREWGWSADISPEDFLDTYLYESFKQRGILLGAYQVINREGEGGRR